MGLQPVGVKMQAEGAERYKRDTEGASQSTDKLTNALKGLGALYVGKQIADRFVAVGRSALSAVASYEQLSMSMSSLVAKEIRTADSTIDMSQAMEMASDRAGELLKWIQDLAIKSPFSQEGVAMAFRTALAYGFTSEEAQVLTAATIDFATATGQSVGVMNQVALALGQIKAKGKLAGQEILQLVNAGFSVNPILQKLGYTMDDVSKGVVSADEFLTEFVKTMRDDFGGAAERSSNTVNGLLDSLGDLKQIGLRELFGPTIQALLPPLSGLVAKIQEMMPAVTTIGQIIGNVTTKLLENKGAVLAAAGGFVVFFTVLNAGTILTALPVILGAIGTALAALLSPIGIMAVALGGITAGLIGISKQFKKTGGDSGTATRQISDNMAIANEEIRNGLAKPGEQSHSWGYNLVINFANGMAKAIGAILQVLTNIGNVIAGWLMPGSPPKLLPDIDDWGTAAMQEYIDGFGDVQFNVFSGVAGKIESYLRSITGDDTGAQTGLIDKILGSRSAVMQAVGTLTTAGQVSEDVFQGIFASAGITNTALQNYVRASFESARATLAVKAAQDALNAVSEKYAAILSPLQQELNDIQKERQAYIDEQRREELQAIIANAAAPAEAKRLAQLELREMAIKDQIAATEEQAQAETQAAQDALTAATTQQEAANQQMEAQSSLLDAQIQNNNLISEQKSLLDSLAESAAGAGGALGGAGGALSGLASGAGGIAALGDSFGSLGESLSTFAEDIQAPFANIKQQFEDFKIAWAGVGLAFIARLEPMTTALRESWGPGGTWSNNMELMKTAFYLFSQRFGETMQSIWQFLQTVSLYIYEQWGEGGTWSSNMELAKTAVGLMGDWFDEKLNTIKTKIQEVSDFITGQWGEGGTWRNIISGVGSALSNLLNSVITPLSNGFTTLKTAISGVLTWLDQLIGKLAAIDLSNIAGMMGQSPSPLAIGIATARDEMRKLTSMELPALQRQVGISIPMSSSGVVAQSVTNSTANTFNIGGNSISNGMDMAQFEAAVIRAIGAALA